MTKPLKGDEALHENGTPLPHVVLDFWRWSCSDILDNAQRGILAEFIVAKAVNAETTLRGSWDAYDMLTPEGVKLEVKSSAYLQSWHQENLSKIRFGIQDSLHWDSATNKTGNEKGRWADVYVFCLLAHEDRATVDPMNLAQWRFHVISRTALTEGVGSQKTMALSTLLKLNPAVVDFHGIAVAVRHAHSGVTR